MRSQWGHQQLARSAGRNLGVSRWVALDQARIDAFADATEDHQWIHVDTLRAASGPFSSTIAHGYLTLSVVGTLLGELLNIGPSVTAVNYGLNRVRFPVPAPAGSRVRASARVETVTPAGNGLQLDVAVTGELDTSAKPALVAVAVLRVTP
jgi:acyl dehydratase